MSDELAAPKTSKKQRRLAVVGRSIARIWTWAGLLLPLIIGALNPQQLIGEHVPLTILLLLFAMAGSNVELRFTMNESAPVYSPVGVPVVLAIVICTPAQAMMVVSLGYLFDRATWQRGRRYATESAGLGAMSTGAAAMIASTLGLSFATPGATLIAALAATCVFLALDALTYAIWYQCESGSGMDILRYFINAAPVDVSFTAIAVALAGPFTNALPILTIVVLTSQLAIYSLYRMISSESRHRAQSYYLRDVFGRYVPESIVEQLSNQGSSVELGGEARDVSVMFCDIRGFTSWAEGREPEQVVTELNDLLGAFAQAVLDSNGTLDKFTGDGLMAFWGAPLEQPDHAKLACQAAAQIHQLVVDRAANPAQTSFRIGIGIASGKVVVGNLGHEKRLDYTAIGDTVNLSARLEQTTKELGITTAIAHDTWIRLPATLRSACPEVTTVCVRGRKQSVRVHELLLHAWATDEESVLPASSSIAS